jgi:hypothetical protein
MQKDNSLYLIYNDQFNMNIGLGYLFQNSCVIFTQSIHSLSPGFLHERSEAHCESCQPDDLSWDCEM